MYILKIKTTARQNIGLCKFSFLKMIFQYMCNYTKKCSKYLHMLDVFLSNIVK